MKIETKVLQEAVKRVIYFAAPTSTPPVYTHFLLDTREGTLKISAFDFEGSCCWDTHCETDEIIYVTVPAKLFHGDIIGINEETLTLSTEGNKLVVKTSRHRAKFDTLDGDQFLTPNSDYAYYEVDRHILDALERCAVAVNTKAKLSVLGGVHLRVNNGHIEAFGTDGIRAGRYMVEFDDTHPFQITVPKKLASSIAKSASGDGPLFLATDSNALSLKTNDAIFTSQLLDGEYPKAWSFFERSREDYTTLKVDGGAFSDALKRAMVFSTGMEGYILLTGADNTLTVQADNYDKGSSQVEMDALCDTPFEIAVNVGYIYDFVTLARDVEITLWVCGKRDAIYLTGLDNYEYLTMPMEIRNR